MSHMKLKWYADGTNSFADTDDESDEEFDDNFDVPWDRSDDFAYFDDYSRCSEYSSESSGVEVSGGVVEQQCKAIFHQLKADYELSIRTKMKQRHQSVPLAAASAASNQKSRRKERDRETKPEASCVLKNVIPPRLRLSSFAWGSFRQWVENHHPGWKAERRLGTTEEIDELDPAYRPFDDDCESRHVVYAY